MAQKDFDALVQAVKDKTVKSEGVILVRRQETVVNVVNVVGWLSAHWPRCSGPRSRALRLFSDAHLPDGCKHGA
jgi:hypothetical protein